MNVRVAQISARCIQFSPKSPNQAPYLNKLMEQLEPPKTLPLSRSTSNDAQQRIIWGGFGILPISVVASIPEENDFLNELKKAIKQGGDIVSARIFCDGGWMAIFEVPAWKDRDPKEYFAAVEQGPSR